MFIFAIGGQEAHLENFATCEFSQPVANFASRYTDGPPCKDKKCTVSSGKKKVCFYFILFYFLLLFKKKFVFHKKIFKKIYYFIFIYFSKK